MKTDGYGWHERCSIELRSKSLTLTAMRNEMMQTNAQEIQWFKRTSKCDPVHAALLHMIEKFSEEIDLEDLAEAAGISRFNLCRNFQKKYGVSPIKWLWLFRTLLAAEFIEIAPDWSLTDIAFTCGFTSSSHFSRSFHQILGVSPSKYRRDMTELRPGLKTQTRSRGVLGQYDALYADNGLELVSNALSRMSERTRTHTNDLIRMQTITAKLFCLH